MIFKYGKRQQRGSTRESLETSVYMSEYEFQKEFNSKKMKFYCYDTRCNQILFITSRSCEYDWYFIEVRSDENER